MRLGHAKRPTCVGNGEFSAMDAGCSHLGPRTGLEHD